MSVVCLFRDSGARWLLTSEAGKDLALNLKLGQWPKAYLRDGRFERLEGCLIVEGFVSGWKDCTLTGVVELSAEVMSVVRVGANRCCGGVELGGDRSNVVARFFVTLGSGAYGCGYECDRRGTRVRCSGCRAEDRGTKKFFVFGCRGDQVVFPVLESVDESRNGRDLVEGVGGVGVNSLIGDEVWSDGEENRREDVVLDLNWFGL